jgi:plastocyanin
MRKGPILAAAVVVLAVPAAAHAETVITAQTVWRFDAPTYTITAGDKVVFKNNDLLSPGPHNVTSEGRLNGQPLFASGTGGFNTRFPVERADLMPAGSYPFLCTIHTFMKGTLVVKPAPEPPKDTTAPKLEAQIRSASRELVLRSGRLRVRLASDEAVRFAVTTSMTLKKNVYALAGRFAFEHSGGPLVVQVPLSGDGRALLRKHKHATIRVTLRAKDAAGNLAVATATRTLK